MLDLAAFLLGAAMLAGTGLLLAWIAAPKGPAAALVGFAVATFGALVLAVEALSLVGALDRAGLLVAHLLGLAGAGGAWVAMGRPRPFGAAELSRLAAEARAGARRHPLIAGLCALAGAAMALQLLVGLVSAPTNYDSMTYHLSRAAYWLQEGAALRFDGGSLRQLDSMPNAEMATAWVMALSGTDRYVELVQWLALATCVAGIAGLARLMGFGRPEAAAAGALFAMLPGPILQSVTTQNDLVASACILAAGLLGARGVREGHAGTLALAGAALGLGLGAKGTVLFALPAVGLIVGAAAWEARPSRRTLTTALAAALAGFALLGAFQYVQNLDDTGSPFGGQSDLVGRERFGLPGNAARVLWNYVDSPGVDLRVADRFFQQTVARVVKPTGDQVSVMRVGTEVDHDRVAGGLIGWLVLWPLALFLLLWRGTRLAVRAQAAAAISFALAIAVSITATHFNGRILLPGLALGAPLLALVARRGWALGAASVLAVASLVPCLAISSMNVLIPERGQDPFFQMDRVDQMTISRGDQRPIVRAVERRYGSRAPLLFLGGEDSWDYPYFGLRRERRVVRVDPAEVPRSGDDDLCRWLRERVERERVDLVLMMDTPGAVPVPPAASNPVEPTPHSFVIDAGDLRRGCR